MHSIPGYVERSAFLFVLVPPIKHHNESRICDLSSWRTRGWCRMEAAAAQLAVDQPSVIICDGPDSTPYLSNLTTSFSVLFLPPGEGVFTCCKRSHIDQNGQPISCDRQKLGPLLQQMLETRLEHLSRTDDLHAYRYTEVLRRHMFQGLPLTRSALEQQGGLAALRSRLPMKHNDGDSTYW